MSRPKKQPSYLFHKPSGQGYARLNGRTVYLGPYGTAESKARYAEVIAEWLTGQSSSQFVITVDELALRYLEIATGYYRKHGEPTNEAQSIHAVLKLLIAFAGPQRVCDFSPRRFQEFRDWLIEQPDRRFKNEDRKLSRQYVNKSMQGIVRAFKWGVAEGIVSPEIWNALKAVNGLRKGRSDAREAPSVKPVADSDVEAVLPHMTPVLRAMVGGRAFRMFSMSMSGTLSPLAGTRNRRLHTGLPSGWMRHSRSSRPRPPTDAVPDLCIRSFWRHPALLVESLIATLMTPR